MMAINPSVEVVDADWPTVQSIIMHHTQQSSCQISSNFFYSVFFSLPVPLSKWKTCTSLLVISHSLVTVLTSLVQWYQVIVSLIATDLTFHHETLHGRNFRPQLPVLEERDK
jgi:hypothetical protein